MNKYINKIQFGLSRDMTNGRSDALRKLIFFFSFFLLSNALGVEETKNKTFTPNWEELIEYMYSMSIPLSELNADTCSSNDEDIKFSAAYTSTIIGTNYSWEEYRNKNNLICVKLHTPPIGFLDERQTKAFLTAHSGHKNSNLSWSVRLLFKYYMFRDRFCGLAYEYKPSQTKGYLVRENLCGNKRLVEGKYIGGKPIIR